MSRGRRVRCTRSGSGRLPEGHHRCGRSSAKTARCGDRRRRRRRPYASVRLNGVGGDVAGDADSFGALVGPVAVDVLRGHLEPVYV